MTIPDGVSGVRWDDGWTDCRQHLDDAAWSSLMDATEAGEPNGVMLIGRVDCDRCKAWGPWPEPPPSLPQVFRQG